MTTISKTASPDLDLFYRLTPMLLLRWNRRKYFFGHKQLTYMGHRVSEPGIRPHPQKQTTARELRRIMRIESSFRYFPDNFSVRTYPLTMLLEICTAWTSSKDNQRALEDTKEYTLQPATLANFDEPVATFIHTDDSAARLGAALHAESRGTKHVLTYSSRHRFEA